MVQLKTFNEHLPLIWFADLVESETFIMISRLSLAESFGSLLEPFLMQYGPGSFRMFQIMSVNRGIAQAIRLMLSPRYT
jgi:hypothetical protein